MSCSVSPVQSEVKTHQEGKVEVNKLSINHHCEITMKCFSLYNRDPVILDFTAQRKTYDVVFFFIS